MSSCRRLSLIVRQSVNLKRIIWSHKKGKQIISLVSLLLWGKITANAENGVACISTLTAAEQPHDSVPRPPSCPMQRLSSPTCQGMVRPRSDPARSHCLGIDYARTMRGRGSRPWDDVQVLMVIIHQSKVPRMKLQVYMRR
jgi:hypothetical protein